MGQEGLKNVHKVNFCSFFVTRTNFQRIERLHSTLYEKQKQKQKNKQTKKINGRNFLSLKKISFLYFDENYNTIYFPSFL